MNALLLSGWLGRDPEDFPVDPEDEKSKRFCTLSLAVKRKGGSANWLPVIAFGTQADWVMDHLFLVKGDHIAIEGFLSSHYSETEEGERRRYVQVVASSVYLTAPSRKRTTKPWFGKGPRRLAGRSSCRARRPIPEAAAEGPSPSEPSSQRPGRSGRSPGSSS